MSSSGKNGKRIKRKPSDEMLRMMLTPRRVKVSAGNLTYVKYEASKDTGKKPVLCLHGFPDNPDTFMNLARMIAEDGRDVYVPYLRGYEIGTAKIGISFDCKTAVSDDLITLINSLRLSHGIHLIGHDWGAFIVSVLAKKIPECVVSITMMAVPHNFVPSAASLPKQLINSWYGIFFSLLHTYPNILCILTGTCFSFRFRFYPSNGYLTGEVSRDSSRVGLRLGNQVNCFLEA